ncbi:hypothetical protein ACJMK2_035129, partial [Sinanodonta woodiana]
GGLAIYVHDTITDVVEKAINVKSIETSIEFQNIVFTVETKTIHLYNIYDPGQNSQSNNQ